MINYNENTINKWNFDDSEIVKVYYNGNVCYQEMTSGSTPPLPYDAEVSYLQDDGTQYINTNAYIDTSNFEIGYTIVGEDALFGYCHQNVVNGTWIGQEDIRMFFGRYGSTYELDMSSYLTSSENTVVYTKSGVTINGTSISKTFNIGSDSIANNPLLFFARYDFYRRAIEFKASSVQSKFKSFYLKNNGTLVVDMIAVRVGQVGYMYDRVSGELFANAGSGNFILGSDIN